MALRVCAACRMEQRENNKIGGCREEEVCVK
jgi:hypothetical protein